MRLNHVAGNLEYVDRNCESKHELSPPRYGDSFQTFQVYSISLTQTNTRPAIAQFWCLWLVVAVNSFLCWWGFLQWWFS